jgi:Rrf2 family transcriptional regulator, iron-sulfur cluster assembly transcription factor
LQAKAEICRGDSGIASAYANGARSVDIKLLDKLILILNRIKKVLLGYLMMLQISRKGDYAIRGMVYLASQPADKVSLLVDIAVETEVPQTFLAKIFQQLNKSGLVKSYRGAGGGFRLGRPAGNISLLEIVETVEGPIVPNRCIMAEGICRRDNTCTVHPVWREVQGSMREILSNVTLKHLAGR